MRRPMTFLIAVCLLAPACSGEVESQSTLENASSVTTIPSAQTTIGLPTTSVRSEPTTTTSTTAEPVQLTSGSFSVPFSMDVPTGSRFRKEAQADVVYFQVASNDNSWLLLTTRGPDSLADWIASVEDAPITTADEVTDTIIGGLEASYIEFAAEGSMPVPGEIAFTFEAGDTGRIYGVTVDGEAVTILAIASAELWPSFSDVVEGLLATLTWE